MLLSASIQGQDVGEVYKAGCPLVCLLEVLSYIATSLLLKRIFSHIHCHLII